MKSTYLGRNIERYLMLLREYYKEEAGFIHNYFSFFFLKMTMFVNYFKHKIHFFFKFKLISFCAKRGYTFFRIKQYFLSIMYLIF